MRWRQGVAVVIAGVLFGCSRPVPQLVAVPAKTEPMNVPAPVAPTPVVSAPVEPAQAQKPIIDRDARFRDLFTRYYEARRTGNRDAVIAMTGGAYQPWALSSLAQDQGAEYKIQEFWGHDESETTVIRLRNGLKGGVAFRLKPDGESLRIVDMLDPGTAHWLSETVRTAPMPVAFQAEMKAHLETFYKARSFTGGKDGVQREALSRLAGGTYQTYLDRLLRDPNAMAETYQIQAINLVAWAPAQDEQLGTAEVRVTRTLTTVGQDGRSTTTVGESRLRVQRLRTVDHEAIWQVVDGFLTQDAAWVSTTTWNGTLNAA
jgi:hypothetical protein